MKPFRFRLQKLLRLREAREEQRLSKFGAQQRILDSERTKLGLFEGEALNQLHEMSVVVARPFRAWMHGANDKYLGRLQRVIDFQRDQTRQQEFKVEQSRQEYLKAKQETGALEKLREHQLENWRVEERLDEQKVLDDTRALREPGGE
ncbi:flagellar export protein FliJ [candidate division KSB1 bacterium]|nr:flagellar export protein FliJ [candidate division KSB1 bacterium]